MAPKRKTAPETKYKRRLLKMRTENRQLRARKKSMGQSLGLAVNVEDWSLEKLAEARRQYDQIREAGVFPMMETHEPELSFEEQRAQTIQENNAMLAQLGLLEAASALRDIGLAAEPPPPAPPPAPPPSWVIHHSPTRPLREQPDRWPTPPSYTLADIRHDARRGVGLRFGVIAPYQVAMRGKAYRTGEFFGVAVAAPFWSDDEVRSLTFQFDTVCDVESGEWFNFPANLGDGNETHDLTRLDATSRIRIAYEQMPGGSARAPLGGVLPYGAPCPNCLQQGVTRRLAPGSVVCSMCGTYERGEERGGGEAWSATDGLPAVRTARTKAAEGKQGRGEEAALDRWFRAEDREFLPQKRALHKERVSAPASNLQ
jgi:hypothetical protein